MPWYQETLTIMSLKFILLLPLLNTRKTPRVLKVEVENNNEDLKEGIEKIEGTLTNTKPKEKVFDEIL